MKCYGLKLRSDSRIRYVGQTVRGLQRRLKEHIDSKTQFPVSKWARKHHDEVEIVELGCTKSRDELDALEIELIAKFRSSGEADLNVTDGGKTTYGPKWIQSLKDAWADPVKRQRRSDSLRIAMARPEVREKLRTKLKKIAKDRGYRWPAQTNRDPAVQQKMNEGIKRSWTEERKRHHSQKMKDAWKRKREG